MNEIRRNDETVRLEPKAMELLVFLADRAGQVVSRDELLSAVWPGVVVGDDALTQAVIKLRKALGDHARAPSYIETISKRGYRLVAAVEPAERNPAEAKPLREPPRKRGRLLKIAGAVCVLMVVSAAGIYTYQAKQRQIELPAIETGSLEEEDGAERLAALPTVMVVPFEPLAKDDEQVYLARGMTSDLTTDLSKLSQLRVISASRVVGETTGAARLPQPRARYLVSGSVQRAAEQLKINVHLIDTATGQQLWSERYEAVQGSFHCARGNHRRARRGIAD